MALLSTKTANNDASTSFGAADGLDGSLKNYWVRLVGVVPATNGAALKARVNGDSGASDYKHQQLHLYGTVIPSRYQAAADAIRLSLDVPNTASEGGVTGAVRLSDIGNAVKHAIEVDAAHYRSGEDAGTQFMTKGFAFRDAAAAITSISFFFDSNTIASGVFELHGE